MVKTAVNASDQIAELLLSQMMSGEEPSYIKTKSLTLGLVRHQPWNMPYDYPSGIGNFTMPEEMPIFEDDKADLTNFIDASVSSIQSNI